MRLIVLSQQTRNIGFEKSCPCDNETKPQIKGFFSEKKQENSLFFKDYNTLREANIWSSDKSDKKQFKEEENSLKNLNYSKITNILYKNNKKL